jgi:glycosyltransferase involved in cell wall biosynthesis
VITTVYNGEPYADRAIPDILGQTFEDFEFILIDDGSTDRTLEILHEVASRDTRVRVLTPGRVGFAAALNYGIARAKGEYIARQDFDDRSYPERLRHQVAAFDADPRLGVVGTYYLLVDEHRGEQYVRMPPTQHRDILLAMARYIPIAHTMVAFRRQSWTDAGGYPEANNLVDLRFWLQVAKKGWCFANIPEVLGEHYVHQTSFFHQAFRYAQRQRDLANTQAQIIRELNLPRWMYAYTAGRYLYAYCPTPIKRVLRRTIGGSKERDL